MFLAHGWMNTDFFEHESLSNTNVFGIRMDEHGFFFEHESLE